MTEACEKIDTCFHYSSIGYAYCPVTEDRKEKLFRLDSKLELGSSRFRVPRPKFVHYEKLNQSSFRNLSFITKSKYEAAMSAQYGLDADLTLVVKVAAGSLKGSWGGSGSIESSETRASMLFEILVGQATIENPETYVSIEFKEKLKLLPSCLSGNEETFLEFFGRYGTHFVNKVCYGGHICINFSFESSTWELMSQLDLNLKAKVLGEYLKNLTVEGSTGMGGDIALLKSIGDITTEISFIGGAAAQRPKVTSVDHLTREVYAAWAEAVEEEPVQLSNFSLYPYYKLNVGTSGEQILALKAATKAFLSQELVTGSYLDMRHGDILSKIRRQVGRGPVQVARRQPGPVRMVRNIVWILNGILSPIVTAMVGSSRGAYSAAATSVRRRPGTNSAIDVGSYPSIQSPPENFIYTCTLIDKMKTWDLEDLDEEVNQ